MNDTNTTQADTILYQIMWELCIEDKVTTAELDACWENIGKPDPYALPDRNIGTTW